MLRAAIRKLHPNEKGRFPSIRRSGCAAVLAALCLAGLETPLSAAPGGHDMYLCASVNRDYIVGAKLVTLSGLYRRTDAGTYEHFGVNYPQIFSISFDPRDRRVFYTATINGCVQTTDGGDSWRISTSWDMTEPKDVCVDVNSPDDVYLALPDGIAVSNDRGGTWVRREKGLPARGKYTQTIKVDRTKAGRVLAGCESGIYLTDNGAGKWRRVHVTGTTVTEIQQSPHDPKLWLAATQVDGVLISRDGGRSWSRINGLSNENAWYSVAFDPTNAARWAVCGWKYGILTTEDAGKSWTVRNQGLDSVDGAFRVSVDPDNGRLYFNIWRRGLYASDDFGRTWRFDGIEGGTVYNFEYVAKGAKK